MNSDCRNCGKHYDQVPLRDWNAVCERCRQLRWLGLGDVIDCTVYSRSRFGVMVKLGEGVEGRIHESELPAGEELHVGNATQAIVIRIDQQTQIVGLSRKRLNY
jgi:ribosomal protein S1